MYSIIKSFREELPPFKFIGLKYGDEDGMELYYNTDGSIWFFERYVHPRFTTADEKNEVILDICHFIK